MPLEIINNAYFSEACPIQPAQAASDYLERLLLSLGAFSDVFNFTSLTMTSFVSYPGWWEEMLNTAFDRFGSTFTVNFDDNALEVNSVNGIIDAIESWTHSHPSTGTLQIGGGTNAVPNPVNVATLEGDGWTVVHN